MGKLKNIINRFEGNLRILFYLQNIVYIPYANYQVCLPETCKD